MTLHSLADPPPHQHRIASVATITAPCGHCGQRFAPSPAQIRTGGTLYCTACEHQVCAACAEHPAAGRFWARLDLCHGCRHIVQGACRSKIRYQGDPGHAEHPDGQRIYTYHCPFCGGWHLTKMPPDVEHPAEHLARRALLIELINRIGWDLTAPVTEPNPPEEPS